VLLYVDGAFLGATAIDFVAPGEAFPVFVGVADQVKLTRALDRKRSALTWSGKRKRMQIVYLLSVENLGDEPVTLELADRIPVSETDTVKVLGVDIEPDAEPDTKGVLRWTLTLAAGEKLPCRIGYTLDYPRELPIARAKAAARDMTREDVDLQKQINTLELQF
jgi:hypothetical protein